MKNVKFLSVFFVCVLVISTSVNATGYRTDFKNYEIETVDGLNLGMKVEKVWTLTYESSQNPVTVFKRNTSDGVEYVVQSSFFEVCYVAGNAGFGAQKVKKAFSNVPKQINSAVLNQEQLKRQRVITPNDVDDEKALGLIANFLPELINEDYRHVLG